MNHFRFALVVFASSLGLAYAQDEEARRAPPVEIPDFSNLDEYIYEPKSTFTLGIRHVSGAKTSFTANKGSIASRFAPGDDATTLQNRSYQDGNVQLDTRSTPQLDGDGNPVIIDNQQQLVPLPNDGKTNTWNYTDLSQRARQDFIAFHDYSAEIRPTATIEKDSTASMGADIQVHRDMGKFFGGRVAWTLTAGLSVNDISANTAGTVNADITSITDYYRFHTQNGGMLPDPPYSAPSSTTESVLGPDGSVVTGADGTTSTRTVDTTVLLDNIPQFRERNPFATNASVTNRWKVKGAYYTFRAGPTLWIPITTRLKASLGAGVALAYAGTSYTVTETLTPDVGTEISETESSEDYKLLPGFYADATLQFDLTERAGLYAGAVYQSTGDYTQTVENATTSYSTKIDLSRQNGVRAGMTIRF
ncbi:MAG: hypothetical protein V4773_30340 [Verrucomicrobiota bacterium]